MADVTVRPATPDDVPGIRRIARRGWEAAYGDFLADETVERALAEWYAPAFVRDAVERDGTIYRVAVADGEVVGYATGRVDDVGRLTSLYVDPDRWGEGIGTRLLEAVFDRLRERGVGRLEVRVLAVNEVGRAFYESRGLEPVAEAETDLFGASHREVVYAGST
ncbi:GNAT family N-acetyltransferase [Halomarina halobia]|uniref:GNAT family N-acetyltransferase n=1 Tax=Halomarina halobia TaxID=3033386 RepID=A0ABD6AAV0_9EURY|nr:GNAT family N-acetyltransferase [Halomarina sp. PSR21]